MFKKGFLVLTLSLLTLPAFARDIRIIGNGTGGTTHGDRQAACERAYDRAQDDAENQCFSRRGYVVDSRDDDCNCHKKPGSRDDYTCRATVNLTCDVPCRDQEVTLTGDGLDYDYNRNQACYNAQLRAENETSFQCSQRDGYVTYSEETSCNCRRLNSGEYECRSVVRTQCEVQVCR